MCVSSKFTGIFLQIILQGFTQSAIVYKLPVEMPVEISRSCYSNCKMPTYTDDFLPLNTPFSCVFSGNPFQWKTVLRWG